MFPIAEPSERLALRHLTVAGSARARNYAHVIKDERERLYKLLSNKKDKVVGSLVERVIASSGNFLLVIFRDAKDTKLRLESKGIHVRDRTHEIENALRITVGTREENNLLLGELGVDYKDKDSNIGVSEDERSAYVSRETKETKIDIYIDLESTRESKIETGIGFFDHMLLQISTHGGFELQLHCVGDLEVDTHHTIEDCGIALGETILKALGDKSGIGRYGYVLPMDESCCEVVLDICGRIYSKFEGDVGDGVSGFSSTLVSHFFRSFAEGIRGVLHIKVSGEDSHHMIESCFKGLGRALRGAVRKESGALGSIVSSSKGVI